MKKNLNNQIDDLLSRTSLNYGEIIGLKAEILKLLKDYIKGVIPEKVKEWKPTKRNFGTRDGDEELFKMGFNQAIDEINKNLEKVCK